MENGFQLKILLFIFLTNCKCLRIFVRLEGLDQQPDLQSLMESRFGPQLFGVDRRRGLFDVFGMELKYV